MASDLPQQPESKIRWYLEGSGDPVSIYARANSCDPARPQLADNFSAIVNYPDGAYAIVSQSLSAFGHHQMAKVELKEDAGELVELAREIDAVAESVRSGKAPPCSGTDGRWSTLLCLAAEQSVQAGQLVMLDK